MSRHIISLLFACLLLNALQVVAQSTGAVGNLTDAEKRVVKLYGEGGVRGIEGYQTGLLVSLSTDLSAEGLILTVDSPTLGGGELVTVLANGDRYTARVQSIDPRFDLALLKIDLEETELACFYLGDELAQLPLAGTTAYALSNTFNIATGDEPITRQRTTLSLVSEISLRRLNRKARPQTVLLLDSVTSNPGSAGGALVDRDGVLLGLIGKESRSGLMGSWLNYALPTSTLQESMELMLGDENDAVEDTIKASSARQPGALYEEYGIALVPQIGSHTPPLVEYVRPDSLAEKAGVLADDLFVSVQGIPVGTVASAEQTLLNLVQSDETIRIALLRNDELVIVRLGEE